MIIVVFMMIIIVNIIIIIVLAAEAGSDDKAIVGHVECVHAFVVVLAASSVPGYDNDEDNYVDDRSCDMVRIVFTFQCLQECLASNGELNPLSGRGGSSEE